METTGRNQTKIPGSGRARRRARPFYVGTGRRSRLKGVTFVRPDRDTAWHMPDPQDGAGRAADAAPGLADCRVRGAAGTRCEASVPLPGLQHTGDHELTLHYYAPRSSMQL
jgi:hypothetical protein